MKTRLRQIGVLAAGVGIIVASTTVGASATTKSQTITVNCNATSVTTGYSIVQGHLGAFKIKQNAATDNRRTDWNAVSSNGNSLGYKHTSTGDTVTWSSVLPSTYTVKARKYVPSDCSPTNPFSDGSYDVNYTVTSTT